MVAKENNNYFTELNSIDVSSKIEKKQAGKDKYGKPVVLSYLSWAYAWGELKKRHPDANYTVYEDASGNFYHTDGRTAWVKTGVTVNGIEHIEYLPVMDYKNQSIPLENLTSFDVNKTIQRSLTKAIGRHGLGLYIYAGEDLPEDVSDYDNIASVKNTATASEPAKEVKAAKPKKTVSSIRGEFVNYCNDNGISNEDLKVICKMYKLNNDASDDSFKAALEYAKSQVKKRIYEAAKAENKIIDEAESFLAGIEEV